MAKINKSKTIRLEPNANKSFSVGMPLVVDTYYQNLGFERVFGALKSKGIDINPLVRLLVAYKLEENHSIARAGEWANQPHILARYGLKKFNQQTLYRTLERLGAHYLGVIGGMQDSLFEKYDFESTDVNLDWTSIVQHGEKAVLAMFGYSRDHQPEKRQLTLGLCELAAPVNIPIGMTVRAGNVCDQEHFADTYSQTSRLLRDGLLVVFDKGANSKTNKGLVIGSGMHYLTAKKLNKSDDIRIANYRCASPVVVDAEKQITGIMYVRPSSIDYLYFSRQLYNRKMIAAFKKAKRMVAEAAELQRDIDAGKKIKKKYASSVRGNVLIELKTTYQTKLADMTEKEAYKYAFSSCTNGREGFFCLTSSKCLTLAEALCIYRRKDSIEKIFHSMKNEIEIKPVRCWVKERQIGVLLIGFIAQLFVSLLRYDNGQVRRVSTKFIKKSLINLTETVVVGKNGVIRRVFSNFNDMNMAIMRKCGAILYEKPRISS